MTAWHGLKARVRRQWALLSFTRSIPIHEAGEQPRFRQTFVLPSSFFFLLLFFSFFFFFGTVSSESEPPFRAAIYVSSSFALRNSLYERVDGNYFSFIYVSLVSLFQRSNVLVNIPRDRASLRIFEGNKGWKIFFRKFEFSKRHADGIVSVRVIKSAKNKQARQVVAGIIIA